MKNIQPVAGEIIFDNHLRHNGLPRKNIDSRVPESSKKIFTFVLIMCRKLTKKSNDTVTIKLDTPVTTQFRQLERDEAGNEINAREVDKIMRAGTGKGNLARENQGKPREAGLVSAYLGMRITKPKFIPHTWYYCKCLK